MSAGIRMALLSAALVMLATSTPSDAAASREAAGAAQGSYRTIPAAALRSILPTGTSSETVRVATYRLQTTPVTNEEYLAFVRTHAQWQRGQVPAVFADRNYLGHWKGPLEPGDGLIGRQPVTQVSWFATRAYCESIGARLPSWHEWELAAAADERVRDARRNPAWQQKILSWYSRPSNAPLRPVGAGQPNLYGIHDLHGLVWEWVDDFNALLLAPDNRNQGDPDRQLFCGAGAQSVEDRESYAVLMRLAMLSALQASSTTVNVGFRCAVSAPTEAR